MFNIEKVVHIYIYIYIIYIYIGHSTCTSKPFHIFDKHFKTSCCPATVQTDTKLRLQGKIQALYAADNGALLNTKKESHSRVLFATLNIFILLRKVFLQRYTEHKIALPC